MPGNNILAPRVLEWWLCVGDFTKPEPQALHFKDFIVLSGWERGAGGLRSVGECSVAGKVVLQR